MRTILLLLGLAAAATAEYKSYRGYKVFELYPKDVEQMHRVQELHNESDLDFWTESVSVGRPIRVKVPPHKMSWMHKTLKLIGADYSITVEDVGVNVAVERKRLQHKLTRKAFDLNDFNTYTDIMDQLDVWQAKCPSNFTCEVVTLGSSAEGRDIKRFSIMRSPSRRSYWIDSTIHGYDWIAPATSLKIIDNFINNYGNDTNTTDLLDTYDWHIIPVSNPDGYEYTWTDDRYWAKDRNINPGSSCIGIKLSRNFDAHWNQSGGTGDPCNANYEGEFAASAQETQIIQNEMSRLMPSLDALIHLHANFELVVYSYCHLDSNNNCTIAPTDTELNEVAGKMAAAIDAVSTDQIWNYGTCCEMAAPMGGNPSDYAYNDSAGVRFPFTLSLRGEDFVMHPSNIQKSFDEFWAGIIALEEDVSSRPE